MEVRDRILIIEDDRSIRKFFRTILEANRYDVISADTGEEGYSLITSQCPDLVILDLGLPDIDGMEILSRLRKWSGMPVVVISARSHEKDKVEALDLGADDYITKPFSMVLLGKRITALLRRSGKSPELSQIQFGDITVNFSGYTAWNQEGQIDLTPKEIELLKLLVEHKGLVLTRSQILDELWGYDTPVIDRTVDTYIKNLRKKLNLDRIVTVKGVGYKYEETI